LSASPGAQVDLFADVFEAGVAMIGVARGRRPDGGEDMEAVADAADPASAIATR